MVTSICRTCEKIARDTKKDKTKLFNDEYYKENKEELINKNKQYYQENKREREIKDKMRKYGISRDLAEMYYDKLIICMVCRKNPAVVDHCHITGKYRGPLCSWCNITEGFIQKLELTTPEEIEKYCQNLAAYLKHALKIVTDHNEEDYV